MSEVCIADAECCSGICVDSGTTSDGRPILRCANAGSCLDPGEVCFTAASANCCPAGGGSTGCTVASSGMNRCFGGAPGCTLPGDTCTMTSDCCTDSFPTIMCTTNAAGAMVCCLADGEGCAFGDTCCSGVCTPDATGTLVCGTSCIADGFACTTDADCCGNCCMGGLCATGSCGGCEPPLVPLGGPCTADADCCDPTMVFCNLTMEFPTCTLR
jgi:hypothetical protein